LGDQGQELEVTATRIPEEIDRLPASLTVVSGEDLRNRGADDLRSALALVPGVDAPSGGDAGPASSVPSLWGLHEFDAFLLVVDGVPWGGAFNPALPELDLNDVERIEILKGPASVMYGATSFVGVIHVIRFPAGQSDNRLQVSGGSRNSWAGDLSIALPAVGNYRQSLLLDANRNRLTGRDQGADRAHVLYRGAADLGKGVGGIDAEYTEQTQLPSSPVVLAGTALTSLTPIDANFNPSDAGIVEHRARLTVNYGQLTSLGDWHTVLSYTRSTVHDVRGFIRPELSIGDDGNNADGFNQDRVIDDAYFDMYLASRLLPALTLTTGVDWLYGHGTQQSRNFAYVAVLDASVLPPPSTSRHIDEINGLDNRRNFGGVYSQFDWKFNGRLDVLAGVRLNRTVERQLSTHIDTIDPANNLHAVDSLGHTRGSDSLGVSLRLWGDEAMHDQGVLFAGYRDAYKPAAIDFGPDVTPDILKPETARSYEIGLKGEAPRNRLEWNVSLFRLDFRNLVVHQTDPAGNPVLANAGQERLQGVESEVRWKIGDSTSVAATYSYHDARFGNTIATEDGNTVQLDRRQLDISPHNLAALGLQYAPPTGLQGGIQWSYVGRRFLDRLNTAAVGGYNMLDAQIGYRRNQYRLTLVGHNLVNRRDPVTGSEFGDRSFYLLPARMVSLSVAVDL
jgi:outer membrane receptor protein involved in Fe transport